MTVLILKDADVVINTVDLSDHVMSITINYGAEIQDQSAMGDDSRTKIGGLRDYSVDINFKQDFSSGSVDATLFPLVGVDTTIVIKPTSAIPSPTNPSFTGTVILESYPVMGNTIGELAQVAVTFQGDGDLVRAEA